MKSTFIVVKHNISNNVDVLLCVQYKDKWCYALNKKQNLSYIENNGNNKQAPLCKSCTSNDNGITTIPSTNIPTGPDLPSKSTPRDLTHLIE